MTRERGAALLGTLAIGFTMLLLVGQALVTVGRIESAATETEEAARYAATWAARHGDATDAAVIAQRMLPDAVVEASGTPNGVAVVVSIEVSLLGPNGSPLTHTVTGRADVPVSPYRSSP